MESLSIKQPDEPLETDFVSFSDDLKKLNSDDFSGGGLSFDDRQLADGYVTVGGSDHALDSDVHSACSQTLVDQVSHEHVTVDKREDSSDSNVAKVNFDVALSVALNSSSMEPPRQVWETGIWKHIFGNGEEGLDFGVWGPPIYRPTPALWGVEQSEVSAEPSRSNKRSHLQTCTFLQVVSFKPDVSWRDQREADLQRGINLWVGVTSRWNDTCSLVHKMNEMRSESELFDMFAHVFSGRSPITIRKRGTAVLRICDYLEKNDLEQFPPKELTFYRFLCQERIDGAPASRLQGTVQAVAFCRHVLDVEELQLILNSKRCSGVAREVDPKERKQASPLKVTELQRLHDILEEGTDTWDSIFAGAALLCAYCRGRWGDLMRSESAFIDLDEGGRPAFIETRTGRHKTMSAQMHRHQFLPMVAPIKGINGEDWATPWMERRKSKGLELPPNGLVMPAPDKYGEASQRPLESGECGKWLRKLLEMDGGDKADRDRRISSHSLKCTFLSYASKRGLSVPDRLMLGYHSSQMHMAMVYSRDGAAASLLLLERLISEIYRGIFKPDSTRSGRIVEVVDDKPGTQNKDVKVEVIISSDEEHVEHVIDSESSGSTSESTSSSQDIPEDHRLNQVFAPPQPPEGFQRWQHSKLKTIHLTEPGYTRVFVCGRSVGSFHHALECVPRFDSPICWACFKKAKKIGDSSNLS